MTKEERLKYQRQKRKANNNAYTQKYEKTKNGFLMRKYRNMLSRSTGVQKLKSHLYEGKTVLDKEDFYEWSNNNNDFFILWEDWVKSGHDRKLCPTVDRIDSSGDYCVTNMRWITHSENSRLGCYSRWSNV